MLCKVGQLATDPELDAMANGHHTATDAAAMLSNAGHPVSPTTVKDHRGKRCSCTRPGARVVAGTKRILVVDIERLPGYALVPFWSLGDYKGRRIHADLVTEWPRTICAAWRWYGDKRVQFAAEWQDGGTPAMLRQLWDAYDNADIVVGHNVQGFDTKKLRAEWITHGFTPPSPVKQVDTLQVARRQFSFESNTLDALAKRLGVPGKVDKYDAQVASAAVAGNTAAQRKLARYNRGDVETTEWVYDALRGWIPNHPHVGTFGDQVRCNQCGSDDLELQASRYRAVVLDYALYRCNNCAAPVRGGWHSARAASSRGVPTC